MAYFDVGFEVPTYRVYFSTSPQDTPTHWRQTVFFLKEPLKVRTGMTIVIVYYNTCME